VINVSVLITTLNAADSLPACLASLKDFDEVIIIDSNSSDKTQKIAQEHCATFINYQWDGQYPKKRQWCLDNLDIRNEFIFFVDADEVLTSELIEEIKYLNFDVAGYFVRGHYVWKNKTLKHGLKNNKLALFHRHKIEFPVVDDLDIEGMGEIEGHYQPVLKDLYKHEPIGQLKSGLQHNAYEDTERWNARHLRYAQWEADMIRRNAYPKDPNRMRECLKNRFRQLPMRGLIAFCHSYFLKLGFLDGLAGYEFAQSRRQYYQMVKTALSANKS